MSLIELTLENPAYKRVIESPSDLGDETETSSTDAGASRRRSSAGIAMVVAALIAALAIKRRRS